MENDNLIKRFTFKLGDNLSYLVSSFLHILDRNNEIEIFIYRKVPNLQDEINYLIKVRPFEKKLEKEIEKVLTK